MSRQSNLRAFAGVAVVAAGTCMADEGTLEADRSAVALLDIRYQFAVERNDAAAIALIHHDNMILVLSNGTVVTGKQIEQLAREKARTFEHQVVVDDSRAVRVWGDTAIVTAKLWLKGTRANGDAFDHKLWYSDTYVRRPAGWRYFFGQAGAPLPQ